MPLQSRPVVVPNPDPSLHWVVPYEQALDLQVVLSLARDLLVSISYGDVEGLYRMRWPLDKNGNLVPPEKIWDFLDLHNVNWACFCIENGIVHLARFVTKPDGTVMVYCGYERSRCPFKLNLTRIYQTTKLRGDKYDYYPTHAARHYWEDAVSRLVLIPDESDEELSRDDATEAGNAASGSEGVASELGNGNHHAHHHEHDHGDIDDDDYGCYECCGEPKPNPRTFVVPIMDGWLGHYPKYSGERTLVGQWQPGRYGWPIGEHS